nr:S-phase kinase-associated protein 2 [Aedes albopictus]XP_029723565.1 LOW QUALITY PROTEIN: S-phase kinase-associated protein 2-like [Aedes albopictus]
MDADGRCDTNGGPTGIAAYRSKLLRFDISDQQHVRLLKRSFGTEDCLPPLGLAVLLNKEGNDDEDECQSRKQRKTVSTMSLNGGHKGRSPLANVSNHAQPGNNNLPPGAGSIQHGANDANLRKYFSVVNDEQFFLYRKPTVKAIMEDHFVRLSDEIILHIFRFLPKKTLIRCGQVSKRFNQVSLDETLWTRLDLSCRSLREGALGRVISRGTVILRLAQAHVSNPVFQCGSVDPCYETKLQFLDLSMCSIERETLRELLSRCRSLRKLSLENVPVDTECCREIACNVNLEALNLTMCEGLEYFNVSLMVKKLTKLHSLNISWTQLSRSTVDYVVTHVTPSLLRLNMAGCRNSMTDDALQKLVDRCPDLVELDLSDCTHLTSQAMKMVCKLKNLEYLSLSRCYNINVTSYLQLSELKPLQFLDVFGLLSEPALAMLQTSFPGVGINKFMHSSVARPTVGSRRTSIWGMRTRD